MPPDASLNHLKDIAEAEAAGFLPMAPGWIILFTLILLLGLYMSAKAAASWHKNSYRRRALFDLKSLTSGLQDPSERITHLRNLPILLKRTAADIYPLEEVAGLSGHEWQEFLSATSTNLSQKDFILLNDISYLPDNRLEKIDPHKITVLLNATETWIKEHKAGDLA